MGNLLSFWQHLFPLSCTNFDDSASAYELYLLGHHGIAFRNEIEFNIMAESRVLNGPEK